MINLGLREELFTPEQLIRIDIKGCPAKFPNLPAGHSLIAVSIQHGKAYALACLTLDDAQYAYDMFGANIGGSEDNSLWWYIVESTDFPREVMPSVCSES
jgi:hypothetical protein